jgi:tetratricopeptide (TPR) repeat protein
MIFKPVQISICACVSGFVLLVAGCATPVDVKGLIAGGQLNQAQARCGELSGPERKDCYSQLSRAYQQAGDFESAARNEIKANEVTVFEEDFHDNHNGWSEADNADVYKKIQNGRLVFAHKRTENCWFAWPKTPIGLNEDHDFRIEAVMTKIDGIDNHRYELVWGLKDVNNYFTFGISGSGSYRYSKSTGGKWEALTDWTDSENIHKFNTTNTLAVEKRGDLIRFFINGQQVLEKPYVRGFGPNVGICLNRQMKVAVSRLVVTQTPTEKETYRKLLDACLARGDFPDFINQCEKAGYNKNEAYVRVAEVHMEKGAFEAAAINLERAGWSVRDLNPKVLFHEEFDDNRNKWFERNDAEIFYQVQNGQYHFDHRRDKGGWFAWPQTLVSIDESGDFRIESTLTKISGVDNSAYELVWGMEDIGNCYTFGISGDGGFLYGKYQQGRWQTLIDWTKSAHINRGNLTNTLAVEKSGERIKFYVNGHVVAESAYEKGFGRRIGFSLNNKMAVDFDNLTVTQYPPKVAHALALKYAPKDRATDAPTADRMDERNDLRRETGPFETPTKR